MANNDSQDRNLPASERKIRKAREDGQVARSRDLGHLLIVGGLCGGLVWAMPHIGAHLQNIMSTGLRFNAAALAEEGFLTWRLAKLTWAWMLFLLPLGAVGLVLTLGSSLAVGGWNFTWKPLTPNFGKLNPLAGLGQMVSAQRLSDVGKAVLLALVLGTIGGFYLYLRLPQFHDALTMPLPVALAHTASAMGWGLGLMLIALAVAAAVDVPLQRFLLAKRLRMSQQEAKQEHKEQEGNPEVKGRIRQRQREMARKRMLAAVPTADLVVMNPTHFAVALKYDDQAMGAPRVVAKGADLIAFKIRDIAREHKVPVLQAPPLARALYAHAELDREIPVRLFSAVAQVLAYVFQLRQAMTGQGAMPPELSPVAVPPDLDPNNPAAAAPTAGHHDSEL